MKYTSKLFPEAIQITRQNVTEVLINLQFQIAGYVHLTYDDILEVDEWYNKYEISMSNYDIWKEECINIIAKLFRVTKSKAMYEASMFGLSYGLKFKDESE